mmetsp:Transcript_35223/g.35740  ORF Transcript_35223/g.35740 Transcript_35223/m.35740 type:complete len:126 (+) Transcript_35223:413-790(+)
MKFSILTVVALSTVVDVVNLPTFVDGLLKCEKLSKKDCKNKKMKGEGICKWRKNKCRPKCWKNRGGDSKDCEKVNGCVLKGNECKWKNCFDIGKRRCERRSDCIYDFCPPGKLCEQSQSCSDREE